MKGHLIFVSQLYLFYLPILSTKSSYSGLSTETEYLLRNRSCIPEGESFPPFLGTKAKQIIESKFQQEIWIWFMQL